MPRSSHADQPAAPIPHGLGEDAEKYLRGLRKPYDEESMMLGLQLVRAGNSFIAASEKKVHRPRGLRWAGFSVMFTLLVYGRLEARSIARLTGVSRQAVSTVLATLQRDGNVERQEADAADRRLVPVTLSAQGEERATDVLDDQLELSHRWFSVLSRAEQREFARLLGKVIGANRAQR